jgi:predicted DCC family thiol-disulfide oxidoreductase YuxK
VATTGPILFYDGVCTFCNRAVQFVLRHDRRGGIRFAALQSPLAAEVLGRHGRDPADLDTMYLLLDPGTPREWLAEKSDAVLAVLRELGGPWALLAGLRMLPRGLRDRAYTAFVRNRYRWFGRYDACPMPPPEQRRRFADLSEDAPELRAGSG